MKTKNSMIVIMILIAIIVGAGGFFAGTKYQQGKISQFMRGQNGNRGPVGVNNGQAGRMGGNGGRQIMGEILAVDPNGITVKLPDGSSRIILMTGTTGINKAAEGTKEDLTAGTRVAVFGTENADKTVTAQNIQINPLMRGGVNQGATPSSNPQ